MTTNFESLSVVREKNNRPIVFGVALSSHHLNDPEIVKVARYVFDSVTCENEMKPDFIRTRSVANTSNYLTNASYDFRRADTIVNYAKNNSMKVLGHTLWYDPINNPQFLQDLALTTSTADKSRMTALLTNHINTNITHFKDIEPNLVYKWHVSNEALDNSGNVLTTRGTANVEAARVLGTGYLGQIYSITRSILNSDNRTKNIKLYYNDYRNMMNQFDTLKRIKDAGNIDGIGIQCHADSLTDLNTIRDMTIKYRKEGFEVHFSEADYLATSETSSELERFYEGLLQIALDYGVNNFTVWGIKDDLNWLYSRDYKGDLWPAPYTNRYPLLFNSSLQPKDCYNALINKLKNYRPIQDYDIFIVLGQSNAVGFGRSTDPTIPRIGNIMDDDYNNTPNDNIKQLKQNSTTIDVAREQLDYHYNSSPTLNYGFTLSFARQYVREGKLGANRKVLLISCGMGGTGFFNIDYSDGHWRRDPTPSSSKRRLYDVSLLRLKSGISPGLIGPNSMVKGIFWLQGESDSTTVRTDSTKIRVYKSYLLDTLNNLRIETTKFINNVRLGLNQDVNSIPILLGQIAPTSTNEVMNRTIKEVADDPNNINYSFVSTEPITGTVFNRTLTRGPAGAEGPSHYNKSSQIELGKRYYYVYNGNRITVS